MSRTKTVPKSKGLLTPKWWLKQVLGTEQMAMEPAQRSFGPSHLQEGPDGPAPPPLTASSSQQAAYPTCQLKHLLCSSFIWMVVTTQKKQRKKKNCFFLNMFSQCLQDESSKDCVFSSCDNYPQRSLLKYKIEPIKKKGPIGLDYKQRRLKNWEYLTF